MPYKKLKKLHPGKTFFALSMCAFKAPPISCLHFSHTQHAHQVLFICFVRCFSNLHRGYVLLVSKAWIFTKPRLRKAEPSFPVFLTSIFSGNVLRKMRGFDKQVKNTYWVMKAWYTTPKSVTLPWRKSDFALSMQRKQSLRL